MEAQSGGEGEFVHSGTLAVDDQNPFETGNSRGSVEKEQVLLASQLAWRIRAELRNRADEM